ncbi:BON domain-containing protein, partial [bacterium]
VADPGIADVAVVNSRSVLLNGKAAGVTSLVIVDGQKIRQYSVRVTAAPGSRPVDVASAIGLPGVSVRPIKDALVLEGEVGSAEEARRAVEIAGIYSPKVVNQMTIRGQVSQEAGAAAQLRDLIGLPNINVRVVGETAILSGTVDTPQQLQDADVVARTVSKNVINQLRLPAMTVDQIRAALGAGAGAPIGSETAGPVAPGSYAAPSPFVVREAGGTLVLEGVVDSQAAMDQAVLMAGRSGLTVVNRAVVSAAPSTEQGALTGIAAAIGRPGVKVSGTTKRLVLEGIVANTEEAVAVEQIARAYSAQVDNLLQTPNPRLVDVDVSIVEITRTGLKNLGFTLPSLLDSSTSGYVLGQRSVNLDLPGALTPTTPTKEPLKGSNTLQTAFQAALRAEITNSNVRLLSNPRTTVLSGRTATFQVGGQVPVPISITQSATGTITGIAFKDFGVLVDVVPNASANGSVTMRVKTEISEPDESIGFTPFAGSSIIPGFQRRAAVTEVTTPAGGTVALGGLISNESRTLITKVPILSKLPILGSLFQSKRFQDDQTELVIFVTPRLLPNPLAAGTTAAAGVVAVGNTTNVATALGNPGLNTNGIGISSP